MRLTQLDIFNVRNIRHESIKPSSTFNFIYGQNGSGKSALIEALFFLGRARSFRTSSVKSVISFKHDSLMVTGEVQDDNAHTFPIGIQTNGKNTDIRINHQANQKKVDLAYAFPLQIIHPKSFELLDASSQKRREFLDWGIFNQDPNYVYVWRKYRKALLHRNALLKSRRLGDLSVWNNELTNYGTIVNEHRRRYLLALKPYLLSAASDFLNCQDMDIKLVNGWSEEIDIDHQLRENLEKDLRHGYTHTGPHRDDFHLMCDNRLVKDVMSRGQIKILVICLKMAQVELIIHENQNFGCILIDDFAAELDSSNRTRLLELIRRMRTQAFITTTELNDFGDSKLVTDKKMFHMEHGKIIS